MKSTQQTKPKINTEYLKNYIKKEHLTQKQFAKACDVSLSSVRKLLAGQSNISIQIILKILLVTNLKCELLISEEKSENECNFFVI